MGASVSIIIVPYDARWPDLYAREAQRIRQLLGPSALSIEHVGSTAVPGLAAKPRIDIDLVVPDSADESSYLPALEGAGYFVVTREPGWHEHRVLKGPDTDVNLHVFSPDAPELQRHRRFRDWLRSHPDDRAQYGALKTPGGTAAMAISGRLRRGQGRVHRGQSWPGRLKLRQLLSR
jgi:GrpB-like predicted nucleotidyltransferase (UPF0157 family)